MDEFQRRMMVQSIQPASSTPVQEEEESVEEERRRTPFPYRWYLSRTLLVAALLVFLLYES